jgi:hypothetical protein
MSTIKLINTMTNFFIVLLLNVVLNLLFWVLLLLHKMKHPIRRFLATKKMESIINDNKRKVTLFFVRHFSVYARAVRGSTHPVSRTPGRGTTAPPLKRG